MSRVLDAPDVLQLSGISKKYAVPVLVDVDLEIAAGEIHALIGANGAGKSTLCKIVSGLVPPSKGRMILLGQEHSPRGKSQAERAGVQLVQQELNLIPTLSIAENLFLSDLPSRFGYVRFSRLRRRATEALAVVGLQHVDPRIPVSELGVGQQQLVEIAKVLRHRCRLLILDEPTAALTSSEIDRLFEQLRQLRKERIAIIYVSHRLEEIQALADRVTVLRDGKLITTETVAKLSSDEMIAAMTGEDGGRTEAFRSYCSNEVALRVSDFTRGTSVRSISFVVKRGERLGVAGLVGSGRTELLRAMFGADRVESGVLEFADGRKCSFRHPWEAVDAGVGLVTENRKEDGLLLSQSVLTNASLNSLPEFAGPLSLVHETRQRDVVRRSCLDLGIRCRGLDQPAAQLSGGNQQKTVVARWLIKDVDILLLDEPTRGIDIGARRRLYRLFEELAARGKSLVIVSSDVDELMDVCDRVIVISAGRLVADMPRGSWTRERILAAGFDGYRSLR